ncbi:MAG: methyltransferase domain-containing protein [Archangium sp.]|nr:methyltransferase domain-containing protein [Archangium sp.]
MDAWSPDDYARFASHRTAPFDDLLKLLSTPKDKCTLLDLGCGTGELTLKAHKELKSRWTLGLDSSAAMLEAKAPKATGLEFEQVDISVALPANTFDRVISNSALNWVMDHASFLPRILELLAPNGELAVQMPSNPGTPFSDCALETAKKFSKELNGYQYLSPVESPEFYAEKLARDSRVAESKVGTWYYPQLHQSSDGILEFAKGGLLSAYRSKLSAGDFEKFCASYGDALRERCGKGPVFFPFRRVFFFAKFKAKV